MIRRRLFLNSSEPFAQSTSKRNSPRRQSLEARKSDGSKLKDLYVDNQSMEINLREAFPDLKDMDNGLKLTVELFLEKKTTDSVITNFRRRTVAGITDEGNVNAALEFIASADPRVDDAVRASENPAQAQF